MKPVHVRAKAGLASVLLVIPLSAGRPVIPRVAAGEAASSDRPALTDYDDFRLAPIRNADLLALVRDADLIVEAGFSLSRQEAPAEGKARWQARVTKWYKGTCGRKITLEGNPAAFENPSKPWVSQRSFGAQDRFVLFLKTTDDGLHRCLDANPGGLRFYRGKNYDHRTLCVGRVNGRRVVEGAFAGRYGRMTGPTTMMDVLRGAGLGLRLAARAAGGSSVELRLENVSKRPARVPQRLALWAPLLWAEIEGQEADTVLLARQDYLLLRAANPWKSPQSIPPGGSVTLRVELPTGPVPESGVLTWAHCNHAKPLAGSLGAGDHTVRLLCHVAEDALVISNPVRVRGKQGAAGPAQLAALERPSPFVQRPESPSAKPATALPKEGLSGEIFFESDRAGSWDIFVMDANGSSARNITNTPGRDEFNPMPSPDGTRVAYVAGKLGKRWSVWNRWNMKGREVWVVGRDGENAKKVADNAIRPNWWPDGQAVIYNAQTQDKKQTVCVQDLQTGRIAEPLKKVEAWLGANCARATFCPATRSLGLEGHLWSAGAMLIVVHLDEKCEFKDFQPLTTGYRGCTPQWLCGDQLHFAHHDPKYHGAIIRWSFKPDGTEVRRFETPARKRWDGYDLICQSPDGTVITYSNGRDICVMRLSDGAEVKLTDKQGRNMAPRWHRGPEGK